MINVLYKTKAARFNFIRRKFGKMCLYPPLVPRGGGPTDTIVSVVPSLLLTINFCLWRYTLQGFYPYSCPHITMRQRCWGHGLTCYADLKAIIDRVLDGMLLGCCHVASDSVRYYLVYPCVES